MAEIKRVLRTDDTHDVIHDGYGMTVYDNVNAIHFFKRRIYIYIRVYGNNN